MANLFDMIRAKHASIEEGIIGGRIKESMLEKYEETMENLKSDKIQSLYMCIEAIVIHIVLVF